MSKGGPWYEPLSGLVVYVYLGQPACGTTVPAKAYHAVPRVGRMLRSESLHHAAAAFPQPLHHHLLGEAGTKFGSARAGNFGHRSSVGKRSVASGGGVVGGFRPDLAKPVFGAYFWEDLRPILNTKALRRRRAF